MRPFLTLFQTMEHHSYMQAPSALSEEKGVEQPATVNPNFPVRPRTKHKRPQKSVEEYVQQIREGNRTVLSQAITLIESTLPSHQEMAQEIIERCLPYSGNSLRVGITGVPGAGKSTFIETLGSHLARTGKKVAVLAIDPSSERSKGSILGDKTRMEELSRMENAFIRPSPSAGSLGGVARKTRETIILCEAAGFDHIIVETVGVGQSETEAYNMVDYFLLIQLANLGDELQGIKRGIMEMADGIAINKADGDFKPKAELAKRQLLNAIQLFPPAPSGWFPTVETCSARNNEGIDRVWNHILEFEQACKQNGSFEKRRREQLARIVRNSIETHLLNHFYRYPGMEEALDGTKEKVLGQTLSPYKAAQTLIDRYFKELSSNETLQDISSTKSKEPHKGHPNGTDTPKGADRPAATGNPTPPASPANPAANAPGNAKTGSPDRIAPDIKLSPHLLKWAHRIPHFDSALAVDAACSGNPGKMEYQGVQVKNGKVIFRHGPFPDATNNIGEFLAIVHALSFLNAHGFPDTPVYSDSVTGMAWVRNKKANTKIAPTARNQALLELVRRAENWLKTHTYRNPVLKWETERWGEIPADFGRKK